MRRLMTLAAIAAAAAGATASIVLTSQTAKAAPALPSNTGYGTGAICVEHLPNNTYRACVAVEVDGSISAGHAAGNGSIRVEEPDTGGIAKFQIDRVAIGTQHAGITSSRSVNSGPTPKPISASTTGADPYYTRCDVRYHVELDFAVRLTNGQLKLGSFVGPWFDSSYAPCAGSDYVAPVRGASMPASLSGRPEGVCPGRGLGGDLQRRQVLLREGNDHGARRPGRQRPDRPRPGRSCGARPAERSRPDQSQHEQPRPASAVGNGSDDPRLRVVDGLREALPGRVGVLGTPDGRPVVHRPYRDADVQGTRVPMSR